MARISLTSAWLSRNTQAAQIGGKVMGPGDVIEEAAVGGLCLDTDVQMVVLRPGDNEDWVPISNFQVLKPKTKKKKDV